MATLIRKNGAYVRYGGAYATDPDLCDCVCGEGPPGTDCDSLPDTLQLHMSYCGREWIETLEVDPASSTLGRKVWEATCDLQWIAECPGDPNYGTVNQQICAVLECLPTDPREFRLTFGTGCVGGPCNTGGIPYMSPTENSSDPFQLVFQSQSGGNWCQDAPPCWEPVYLTVTIPDP